MIMLNGNSPSNKFQEVVVEGNACSSIKDAGMSITNEVRRHNLQGITMKQQP